LMFRPVTSRHHANVRSFSSSFPGKRRSNEFSAHTCKLQTVKNLSWGGVCSE
jgi:hypothetical protein